MVRKYIHRLIIEVFQVVTQSLAGIVCVYDWDSEWDLIKTA